MKAKNPILFFKYLTTYVQKCLVTIILGGFKTIGRKRSTNTCNSEAHKPKRFKEDRPSVMDHFSKKRQKTADDPEDRFGDAGND